ncbi:DUF2304 domain-containing protein [Lachnospiraceae bacterium 48-42]|nr:DUF2304 domain-containing protein [Dorea sp.]
MGSLVVKLGIAAAGLVLMVVSFLMHSYKKITVNYTVIWELLGIVLILIGCVPVFSEWTKRLASGTGLAFACVGAIFLFEEFRNSVMISQLLLKTREMAMQVSMLNQENERLVNELERISSIVEGSDEKEEKKDTIRS